jgi:HSP20 family protein
MYRWHFGRNPLWGEFDRLRREMDSLAGAFSNRTEWSNPLWRESRIFPLLNVTEHDDAFVVKAEIPGMRTDDLEIKIEGDTLTLKGERKPDDVEEGISFHRRERAIGAFQRSLTLPGKVDSAGVRAGYKSGVLTVTLMKEKESLPKQIKIIAE